MRFDYLFDTIPVLFKTWSISFDLILFGTIESFGSILHFTIKNDHGLYGERTPAIWTLPNNTKLHLASAVNGKPTYTFSSYNDIPINKTTKIKVEQRYDYFYNAFWYNTYINDVIVHSIENSMPGRFENVKVYIADPWHRPANGFIKHYKFVNNIDGKVTFFSQLFVDERH